MLRQWVSCYGSQGHNKPVAPLYTSFGKKGSPFLYLSLKNVAPFTNVHLVTVSPFFFHEWLYVTFNKLM